MYNKKKKIRKFYLSHERKRRVAGSFIFMLIPRTYSFKKVWNRQSLLFLKFPWCDHNCSNNLFVLFTVMHCFLHTTNKPSVLIHARRGSIQSQNKTFFRLMEMCYVLYVFMKRKLIKLMLITFHKSNRWYWIHRVWRFEQ